MLLNKQTGRVICSPDNLYICARRRQTSANRIPVKAGAAGERVHAFFKFKKPVILAKFVFF